MLRLETFFNGLSGWNGYLAGTGLTVAATNPYVIGIAVCCIFILFNYDDAY